MGFTEHSTAVHRDMGNRAGYKTLGIKPLAIGLLRCTSKETLAFSLVKLSTEHKQYDMGGKNCALANHPISGFTFVGKTVSPLGLSQASVWGSQL